MRTIFEHPKRGTEIGFLGYLLGILVNLFCTFCVFKVCSLQENCYVSVPIVCCERRGGSLHSAQGNQLPEEERTQQTTEMQAQIRLTLSLILR